MGPRSCFPLLVALLVLDARASEIKSDETVVFFPTTATLDGDGGCWTVPIHGWVFEPERDSLWRREVIEEIQEHLGVAPDSEQGRRCADRAALFLVDNERGKVLRIRIAGRVHELEASEADGHFEATLRLDARDVDRHAKGGTLVFEAVTAEGDARRFAGRVLLPPRDGVSVISDIDDTIKVSCVRDRRELLRRTFTMPFEAVPGMAPAYAAWAGRGATFHYVSSSPWQLHESLRAFASDRGFPAGAFHLKRFRFKDRTLLNLLKTPLETKPPVIRGILARYPRHRFVFVGDSGEEDPEVYGLIARERPGQVLGVFIRLVDGADNRDARFHAAFAGVPQELWKVFTDPAVLRAAIVATPGR